MDDLIPDFSIKNSSYHIQESFTMAPIFFPTFSQKVTGHSVYFLGII